MLYIGAIILLDIPSVQKEMSRIVSTELSQMLNCRVSIDRIKIGLFNRVIIYNLNLDDQQGKPLLTAARLSTNINLLDILQGEVSINNIQLYGFDANIYKASAKDKINFQYIIDAFSSDTKEDSNFINLKISKIMIRRGNLSYNVLDAPTTPNKFNSNHLDFVDLNSKIALNKLNEDSINLSINSFSVAEKSGLKVNNLMFHLIGNEKALNLKNFKLLLPNSCVALKQSFFKYEGIDNLTDLFNDALFNIETDETYVTPADVAAFVPFLHKFKAPLYFKFKAEGKINDFVCPQLSIYDKKKSVHFQGKCTFENITNLNESYIFGDLSKGYISKEGIDLLINNLALLDNNAPLVATIKRLGFINFYGQISGFINDMVAYGAFKSSLGVLKTDIKLMTNDIHSYLSYSGKIKTTDYKIGQLLNDEKLDKVSLQFNVDGLLHKNRYNSLKLNGAISSFGYNKYNYNNIAINGVYKERGFKGKITMDDPNGSFDINGVMDFNRQSPTFDFVAQFNDISLHNLKLTPNYKGAHFSLAINSNFKGDNIDNFVGKIDFSNFRYKLNNKNKYQFKHFNINIGRSKRHNNLSINSDFMKANIQGLFEYSTLKNQMSSLLHRYLPSLFSKKRTYKPNDFKFDINIYDTKLFNIVFKLPIEVYKHSSIAGSFSSTNDKVKLKAYFPELMINNRFFESGMILLNNDTSKIDSNIRFITYHKGNAASVTLNTLISESKIKNDIYWGNTSKSTYSGHLSFINSFAKNRDKSLKTFIDIQPTSVILNDTIWNVKPSTIVASKEKIEFNNFKFADQRDDRYIKINGVISPEKSDSLQLNLRKVDLKYIFDITNLSRSVAFEGTATGTAYGYGLLKEPFMHTSLFIKDFSLNGGDFGDLSLYGLWDHEKRGILLNGEIANKNNKQSSVNGYIFPLKPESGLDLHITANELNMKFLEHYLSSIASDLNGTATGKVRLYGKFKGLNLDGAVATDASMRFDILSTHFIVNDTIKMSPNGLQFKDMAIGDMEGHKGSLNGYLKFKHFKDLKYNFDIKVNNMLLINTKRNSDVSFFGKVYGTGNTIIKGDHDNGLDVNVAITTNKNSEFTYINNDLATVNSNQFIVFHDKTPRRVPKDSIAIHPRYKNRQNKNRNNEFNADVRLNIQVDATPDLNTKIIMDPIAGDYITAKGYGNVRTEYYNKGDFKLFGNYQITNGVYKFSLQEVIRKDFKIKDGSTINFVGKPLESSVDIRAFYTVNSASLNDLMPDAKDYVNQTNVRVNCLMNLTGLLVQPQIKLDIELPNEREEVQTLVRNYISTDEQMNMQFLYLLGIGKFYTDNSIANAQKDNSNLMPSVISSTLSGQLNSALSQILNNSQWNVGTNLSTGEKGWDDLEFEGMLSGQLLNNRLIINGNFGYRENPMSNNNFIGDFKAEWLLTPSGNIRLKAYNETNDRYYSNKTNLTTQGVGIVYKKSFNKWSDLFFWKSWAIKRKKAKEKKEKEDSKREREEEQAIPTEK